MCLGEIGIAPVNGVDPENPPGVPAEAPKEGRNLSGVPAVAPKERRLAERGGFEPPIRLYGAYRISNPAH